MTRRFLCLVPAALATLACAAPQVAYNPRFNFNTVRRVAVATFAGPDGDVAADMLTQSLVAHGADVVERTQLNAVLNEYHLASSGILDPATVAQVGKILGVDALFVGTVVASVPSQSYVVTTNAVTFGSVTPVAGSDLYSEGSLMGIPNSEVVTSAAEVSMVVRMVDVQSGEILWSASMGYQGLDTASAMSDIADSFVSSLVPIWPQLIAPKS